MQYKYKLLYERLTNQTIILTNYFNQSNICNNNITRMMSKSKVCTRCEKSMSLVQLKEYKLDSMAWYGKIMFLSN